jgi:putative membrane protein
MEHHAWTWKPDVFAAGTLAASGLLYVIGLWRMFVNGALPQRFEIVSFATGWLTLTIALLSPIATVSEWLFSVHMTQHELLMLVAAPLLAIARPLVPMMFALPKRWRTHLAPSATLRLASSPAFVFFLHAFALWIWHVPVLYEAAVLDDRIHLVQHVCFAGTAMLFWWGMIRGRYGRLGFGAAFLYIFATAVHSGGLGALLAFSHRAWYSLYVQRAQGGDAVSDQQLGGLIMWVPAGVVMMLFGLAMFAAWLGEAERRRQRGWSQ